MVERLNGACHCAAVRFEVTLRGGFESRRRCTCSLCRMRGAVAVSAAVDDLRIVAGAGSLSEYRFGTGVARHFFCSVCGVYTHHRRRSNPHEYGVNVACLDGVSPFDFETVPVTDGTRHPNDSGLDDEALDLGTLRFERRSRAGSARAYVAGTFDTKARELGYLARRLEATGVDVVTVDLGTREHGDPGRVAGDPGADPRPDVAAAQVAAHHPEGADAVLGGDDRGAAIAAMGIAFARFAVAREDLAGLVGAGGSGGTALLAPAMRALPVGVPKVLVSTVASGDVAPYVGASDIAMMYSVTDVQGLNRFSRRVLGNAAHALGGMVGHAHRIDAEVGAGARPGIGLTMFGVTTPAVQAVVRALEPDHDCLVFHATGTGGRSMERLADAGHLDALIDLTTTEIADLLVGGVFAADEDRLGAAIRTGLPYVGSVGALDMVNFGARDSVPAAFAGRRLHAHNPQVTLMRTTPQENARFGEWLAARLNRMPGEVRFLLPERGVSALDTLGQPFHDPVADAALFESLERHVERTPRRRLVRVAAHVNDAAFAEAVTNAFREIAR